MHPRPPPHTHTHIHTLAHTWAAFAEHFAHFYFATRLFIWFHFALSLCARLIVVGFIKTFKVYGRFSVFLTFLLAIKNSHRHTHTSKRSAWSCGGGGVSRCVGVCASSPCVPRMYLAYFVICINTGNGNDSHDTEMARHLISMQHGRDSIAPLPFSFSYPLTAALTYTLRSCDTNKQQIFSGITI